MLTTTIFQLALVIGISHAWPTTLDGALKRADHVLGSTGCRALYAALPDAVFSASSTQYTSESEANDNWSMTNIQTPQCLFKPLSPQELAEGLKILVEKKIHFAVRGGGHMPVPGSSSISNGVLITSSGFADLQISSDHSTVRIGAGHRWADVYSYLAQYNKVVPGGRFGHVGVPGLLLGGGINYFGNTVGWSMNSVITYEIVLADGRVSNVTETSAPDLFWALKGGSSNFGIVTAFVMRTYPIAQVYGGLAIYDESQLDALVDASVSYLDNESGGIKDLQTAIDPSIGLNPVTNESSLFSVYFRNGSQDNPASLANFTNIPPLVSTVGLRPNFSALVDDTLNPLINTNAYRRAFWSVGVKSHAQTARLTHDTFWPAVKASGINATLYYTFQPITTSWARAAKALGGDVIDLDPEDGDLMALLFSATWSDPALDSAVEKFFQQVGEEITQKAREMGHGYDFAYLNDAGGAGNPFVTYGKGSSLPELKRIAKEFDPSGVFQTLLPGGFKLF